MQTDEERSKLTGSDARFSANASGLLGKVLTFASAVVLLVVAFMFSLLVFALLVTVGLLVWGYLWWKTRELRRQMRERPPGGHVIEGEAIRDDESHDKIER
jgi:Flp pilus assembly protein TadB